MNLAQSYQNLQLSADVAEDWAQQRAVEQFQRIYDELLNSIEDEKNLSSSVTRFIRGQKYLPCKGLYLWGGVGRGKTWLMDMFYNTLPFENKQRIHFHHFMISVHEELAKTTYQKNPLVSIATDFAEKYRVMCIDEFIVTNITDAMLLYGLLDTLFEKGVTMVLTSNRVPDDLYKNGLQRDRFVPAIDLIHQKTQIVNIDGGPDHRLELLEKSNTFYTPCSNSTDRLLEERFIELASSDIKYGQTLTIKLRPVHTVMTSSDIAWFEFDDLCDAPRASPDYIDIASEYHTVILSSIPIMGEDKDDKARRFIYLIDELYDRNVQFLMSAEVDPPDLYQGRELAFAFRRTVSRLEEMRSRKYREKEHKT